MTFEKGVLKQARKLAAQTPEEIRAYIAKEEQEEIRRLERLKALSELAKAYAEGLEAGGRAEAERRMEEKFNEINPPDPQESDTQR